MRSDATSGAQRADEAARADLDALCRTLEELKREVEWLKAREQAREAARLEGDGALDRLMAALPGQPLTDTEVDELLTPEALALLRRPFADE